jgi:thioredoxin-related protein
MRYRARSSVLALAFIISTAAYCVQAAELVMIDSAACGYCQRFNRDIALTYASTSLGKRAPLRPVSVWNKWPQDLSAVKPVRFTPVFILVDDGKEIGRMYGYKGKEDFWGRLEVLLSYL